MNRRVKIALNVTVWVILLGYLVVAARYCSHREADRVCSGLNITVKDSPKIGLITPETVRTILVGQRMKLTGARLDSIDLLAVEKALTARSFIKSARVYTSLDNKLNIEVEQRAPVARVQTANGYRFFLSSDGYVMPLRSTAYIDVPIVTGVPEFPFGIDFEGLVREPRSVEKKSHENYLFLHNLINFVRFMEHDPFWGAQIVQINVIEGNEVELIPRVGREVILLGGFDDYEGKLDKLYAFYRKGLAYEGWDKYTYIDLKYKGQVVCTE